MKTQYPGIDYSRGVSNCDSANGIRYGVISCHSVDPDSLSEIYTNGTDVAYAESLEEYLKTARETFAAENPESDPDDFDEENASQEFADGYESDGGLSDYLYESDGYKLTGCLTNDIFVLKSPFFTFAQFCSPCVPGAGNLDSSFEDDGQTDEKTGKQHTFAELAELAGFPRVYCLGHNWFENGVAPYAVYSVETGKLVTPTT